MAECAFFLQKRDIEMYEFMSGLLADKKDGVIFTCFGVWHWIYIGVIFGIIIAMVLFLRGRSSYSRKRAVNVAINCAFGLYILDFFLMPLAYGAVDLEKMPFHMCTAMCVMCFLSRHTEFFSKYRIQFAILGLLSNMVYVIYPAGVGWQAIHPLCYRTVQTLLFHGVMTCYGIFTLTLDDVKLRWSDSLKELKVLVIMVLWALFGNNLYNGVGGDYSYRFNWFFVTQDPFGILPADIAVKVMPFVVIAVFYIADLLLYAVYFRVKKAAARRRI